MYSSYIGKRDDNTFRPSPRFESSLLVNVLLVSMPESRVVESWLFCRSDSHRVQSFDSWPSNRTVFFRRSVYRRLSTLYELASSRLVPALVLPLWLRLWLVIRPIAVFTWAAPPPPPLPSPPLLTPGAIDPDTPPLLRLPLFQYGSFDCA